MTTKSLEHRVRNSRNRINYLPDHEKVLLLLLVYGLIGISLVYFLGLEGTGGSFTGINGITFM